MSSLSQFGGGGIPLPTAAFNGAAALVGYTTSVSRPLQNGLVNAKSVVTGALTAATLSTILNLSGKGVISFLACNSGSATGRTHRFKITLDGTVVFDATSASTGNTSAYFPVIGYCTDLVAASFITAHSEPIYFNTSLLVEYASSLSETGLTDIAYKYYAR